MITINVIENKICGNYGEHPFTVDYSKELYDEMQGLADQANNVSTIEQYNEILEAFTQLTIVDYTKTIETQIIELIKEKNLMLTMKITSKCKKNTYLKYQLRIYFPFIINQQ